MKKEIVILILIIFGFGTIAKASDTIVNKYARVISVLNKNSFNPDTLKLDSLFDKSSKQLFFNGDTVLIHQTKDINWGYGLDNGDPDNEGTVVLNQFGVAGSFEIHIVEKVDVLNKYLILRGNLHKQYNANHVLQVVKVFTYSKKTPIKKTITALAWDSVAKKGGIVAIISDSIKLYGNIDVTGKGFMGADPGNIKKLAICALKDSIKLKGYSFTRNSNDSSGLKGESCIVFDSLPRGRTCSFTGGGGGNGYHAGGGGGGGYYPSGGSTSGGTGAHEGSNCVTVIDSTGGLGGLSWQAYFSDSTVAFFGGGGGCSTQSPGFVSTKGGNGGGIIVIMANYIDGNGYSIIANGASVTDIATSGAGGGGAGGTVLLDINSFKSPIYVKAKGGNGGSTYNAGLVNGTHGGGGGGGLIWYSTGSKPMNTDTVKGGLKGNQSITTSTGSNGRSGGTKTSLHTPLFNFLFNIMPAGQEICETDTPKIIVPTTPKGGDHYTYLWQKSTNQSLWNSVGSTANYQPGSLIDTIYYRRVVRAFTSTNDLITTDTSFAVKINVLPKIINNTLVIDTSEICQGLNFPYIHANSLIDGGNKIFKYEWQDSTISWNVAPGSSYLTKYQHPIDTGSIYLRLHVSSGVCTKSYSNKIKITVWKPITGNSIAKDNWVEQGRVSSSINGSGTLSGGKIPSSFSYQWQQSKNGSLPWLGALGTSVNNSYVPKSDSTRFYRRMVYSGQYNTCSNTSNVVKVTVLDSLTNNVISGSATICAKTKPAIFTVSTPVGGNNVYSYKWEISSPSQSSWKLFTADDTFKNYVPKPLLATTYFRRIVFSGTDTACKDTSNVIKITIVPYIYHNIIPKDTIICSNQSPEFIGSSPLGGNNSYSYNWLVSTDSIHWNTTGKIGINFINSSPIVNTTYYCRKVTSSICFDTSNIVKTTVLPALINTIPNLNPHVCFKTKSTIVGNNPTGGDNTYKYNWKISSNAKTWDTLIVNNSNKDYEIDSPTTGNYYIRIVKSGLHNCCVDTSTVITLSIDSLPKASFNNFNKSVCAGISYSIPLTLQGKTNFNVSYNDGFNSQTVSNINTTNYILNVIPSSQNTFNYSITEVIDGNNCIAKNISSTGILNAYTRPTANAGKDTAFCGLVAELHAIPSVGSGKWTSITGTDFGGNQTNPKAQATVTGYDSQLFTWTENNNGCKDSASITVRFDEQPNKSEANAGTNQIDTFNFKAQLNALTPSVGIGKWSSPIKSIKIEDSLKNNTNVSNLSIGSNIFIWTISNGVCKAFSDSVIIINNDIKVPGGISPNNDGKNDIFKINGLENVENAELFIVNKWGAEMYHNNNYKNDWNGGGLPSDTYYYILNVVGRTYKGYLIIRK